MARIFVVTSGKGGVGKTTLTAHIGRALASLNQRVALMDVDLGLNNLDVVMGVENKIVYDLVDVVEGRCRLAQALIADTEQEGLAILPSCHSYDKSRLTAASLKSVVNALAETYDYVLIDSPAGIELGFHRAVSSASEALVIITPHISSIRDADKVLTLLKSYDLLDCNVIINRARGDLMLQDKMVNWEDIGNLLKKQPIGIVPEDDRFNVTSAIEVGKKCESMDAVRLIASNIHHGENKLFDVTKKYKGMLGRLKSNLKKIV